MGNIHTIEDLRLLQSMPLLAKVAMTKVRIHEWMVNSQLGIEKGIVSFSGGKDSTVLLHIARQLYPDIPAVFSNTGLEFPEIQSFVMKQKNVDIIRPKMQFMDVVRRFGYPLVSKEVAETVRTSRRKEGKDSKRGRGKLLGQLLDPEGNKSEFNLDRWALLAQELPVVVSANCCGVMKKRPLKEYEKKTDTYAMVATMAEESRLRTQSWLAYGCNAFDAKRPLSKPMSFWTEQDVLQYIVANDVQIASVYGDVVAVDEHDNEYDPRGTLIPIESCRLKCTGAKRTGCIFCGFGLHLEKGETRFQRLAKTHPRQYEYCIRGGQWVDNPDYDATLPAYDGEWKNWNPKKIFVPSKEGLGMGKVFDMVNEIYGKDLMRYE